MAPEPDWRISFPYVFHFTTCCAPLSLGTLFHLSYIPSYSFLPSLIIPDLSGSLHSPSLHPLSSHATYQSRSFLPCAGQTGQIQTRVATIAKSYSCLSASHLYCLSFYSTDLSAIEISGSCISFILAPVTYSYFLLRTRFRLAPAIQIAEFIVLVRALWPVVPSPILEQKLRNERPPTTPCVTRSRWVEFHPSRPILAGNPKSLAGFRNSG